jgi:hypothetical protein
MILTRPRASARGILLTFYMFYGIMELFGGILLPPDSLSKILKKGGSESNERHAF